MIDRHIMSVTVILLGSSFIPYAIVMSPLVEYTACESYLANSWVKPPRSRCTSHQSSNYFLSKFAQPFCNPLTTLAMLNLAPHMIHNEITYGYIKVGSSFTTFFINMPLSQLTDYGFIAMSLGTLITSFSTGRVV